MTSPPTPSMRRGVWLFPNRSAATLVDCIVAAEQAGLDEVWIADEGVARDPAVILAGAAQRTERITLATGITSPILRHPGAIAATMATIDELSDGRACLGLGVGGGLSLGPFGLTPDRPVGRVRDAITVARGVLGRRAVAGYVPPEHAQPARAVPIWVGARGPQLVALTAREADGLFISGCSVAEQGRIRSEFQAAGGTSMAVYESVSDRPANDAEVAWDRVSDRLGAAVADGAASIGISLIDPIRDPARCPVAEVERAAEFLGAL